MSDGRFAHTQIEAGYIRQIDIWTSPLNENLMNKGKHEVKARWEDRKIHLVVESVTDS